MANVEITRGGTGICSYCEEKPATKTVNGEWPACDSCAHRVYLGTLDVGYEAYMDRASVKADRFCTECGGYGYCDCMADDFEQYAAELAQALPVIPPKLKEASIDVHAAGPKLTSGSGPALVEAPADSRDPAKPP